MRSITATITRSFDFSDSIATLDEERAKAGEPPMTDEEIREYVAEDIASFYHHEYTPEPEITIENP